VQNNFLCIVAGREVGPDAYGGLSPQSHSLNGLHDRGDVLPWAANRVAEQLDGKLPRGAQMTTISNTGVLSTADKRARAGRLMSATSLVQPPDDAVPMDESADGGQGTANTAADTFLLEPRLHTPREAGAEDARYLGTRRRAREPGAYTDVEADLDMQRPRRQQPTGDRQPDEDLNVGF
jgi:hypothetical protein